MNIRLLRILFTAAWVIAGLIILFFINTVGYNETLDLVIKLYIVMVPVSIGAVTHLVKKEERG